MATWADVDELAGRLPGAELGIAHEGSAAWYAGRHTFARLGFDDDGRELAELVLDSYDIRGGRRRRGDPGLAALLS